MRDERASTPRVRIAVIGSSRVGKSALIVRYLTRRYIGEYHSNTDLLYRQTVPINGTPVELEVIDVSGSNADKFPAEQIQWADACLLVYAVTDRSSFEYATEVLSALKRAPTGGSPAHGPGASAPMPLALLGNKTDLDHLRQRNPALLHNGNATLQRIVPRAAMNMTNDGAKVLTFPRDNSTTALVWVIRLVHGALYEIPIQMFYANDNVNLKWQLMVDEQRSKLLKVTSKEGQAVSVAHGASFSEASVADNSGDLYRCVDRLLSEVRTPQRTRKFSVTKMLGSLIGGAANNSQANRSGSVVACPRVPAPARPPLAAAAP